jgi:hypothetical protein
MSEFKYRFFHNMPGRRMTVPKEIEEALEAKGEKGLPKFGADRIFGTNVEKVAEWFKKHKNHGITFRYVKSAAELEAMKREEETETFIKQLRSMPGLNQEMLLESCDDIQIKVWARQIGIETIGASSKQPVKVETLKKKISERIQEDSEKAPVVKTQPHMRS